MNNERAEGQPRALSNKTLLIVGAAFSLFMFIMSGFSFPILLGVVIACLISAAVYKSVFNAELKAQKEIEEVIYRHKYPEAYSQRNNSGQVEVVEIIDEDLEMLLGTAFEDVDVNKIQKSNSPFDPSFEMTWQNFFHYLRKGKQINK